MKLSTTLHTLEKLELVLKALHYKVRYEKGNFKTGACILENSRIIVVNKYSNLESKILALAELLLIVDIPAETLLDDKQKTFLHSLRQTKIEF